MPSLDWIGEAAKVDRQILPRFRLSIDRRKTVRSRNKNARDWSNEDSTEKRNLGELWEERSGDLCLFIMPKGIDDLESIRAKIDQGPRKK